MGKVSTIQTNFTAGEVSPQINGRVDLSRYANGAAIMENFIVRPQGGAYRRSGSRFVNEVKNSDDYTRLIPFEFSDIQAYSLEFGDSYMRVYMDGGIVESAPSTPVEVVTPWDETETAALSFTQSADILYVSHPDYQTRKISRTSHTAWTISLYETTDGPYLPINKTDTEFQLSTIVDRETIINSVSEFVVGDVGKYIEYNKDGIPTLGLVIAYVSGTELLIEPKENIVDELDQEATTVGYAAPTLTVTHDVFTRRVVGAYIRVVYGGGPKWHLITAYDGATRDAVTANAALTMVATTGVLSTQDRTITGVLKSTTNEFVSTDVDRHFRMNLGGDQIWGTITTYTSATQVVVAIKVPIPLKRDDPTAFKNDNKSKLWRLGAWGETTGWPSAVTFHEQRLVFAGTVTEPQTIWMSRSSDYENFSPTEPDSSVLDDSGLTYTMGSNKVNAILWLRSTQVLTIGTIGGEWVVRASATAQPITPTNISLAQQTAHGSALNNPEKIGNSVLFIQRASGKARELGYSFDADSFVTTDLTIISEHILRDHNGAVDMSYQEEPDSLLWFALSDGQLACLTYVKEQEVFAWHRHILGGEDVAVESISVVPSSTGNTLYMVVARTVDGATVRYVELLESNFTPVSPTDKDDMFFVDSGLSYDGAPADTFSGLDHLEGEEVAIVADGSVLPNETVTSGEVTTDALYSVVHVGLPYTSVLRTLPLEGGGDEGTAQGKIKRIDTLSLRLVNSLGFKHGNTLDELIQVSFRESNDEMNVSPPLFTGDQVVEFEGEYELSGQYYIVQEQAYPLTVLALMPEFSVNQR